MHLIQPSETAATTDAIPFTGLGLTEPLLRALQLKNYTVPSPIQAQSIPFLLQGRDLIGIAQTGTGKTAAFALPILQRLAARPAAPSPKRPRALVLAPTRELAVQIAQSFATYGKFLKLTHAAVFGGVNINGQIRLLAQGVDILIATPGRLMDLERQRHLSLDRVEVFVLDEADRMLDLGFAPDVKRIIARLPAQRQSLLFSATMPAPIQELANALVHQPARVEVAPVSSTAERVEQQICHVGRNDKRALLVHLLGLHAEGLVLVFVRMKHAANRLVEQLARDHIRAEAIHGNKSQAARQRALENFRTGRSRILVATDIAARGIDVKGVELVVNFDLPEEPEAYVHRIGRTARAGRSGRAIAFCDESERDLLRQVERLIRTSIPVLVDHPYALPAPSSHSPRGPVGDARHGRSRPAGHQGRHGHRPSQPRGEHHGMPRGHARPGSGGGRRGRFSRSSENR